MEGFLLFQFLININDLKTVFKREGIGICGSATTVCKIGNTDLTTSYKPAVALVHTPRRKAFGNVFNSICRGEYVLVRFDAGLVPPSRLSLAGKDEIKLYLRIFFLQLKNAKSCDRVESDRTARAESARTPFDQSLDRIFQLARKQKGVLPGNLSVTGKAYRHYFLICVVHKELLSYQSDIIIAQVFVFVNTFLKIR